MYCVTYGDSIGNFILMLTKDEKTYTAIMFPDCVPMKISELELREYLRTGLLQYVKRVPNYVVKDSIREYNHRMKTTETTEFKSQITTEKINT